MATDATIERDLRRILWIQAVRAFLYGFGAVILGSALAASGASDLEVGILTAAILAGVRGYGRDNELEADRLGAEYLARAG